MPECKRYEEYISARLDGQLSRLEELELDAHLAGCPACRALAEDLDALHRALGSCPAPEAPADLLPGVMEKIRRTQRPLLLRPRVRALAGLAACAVLCAGLYGAGLFRTPAPQGAEALSGAGYSESAAPADSALQAEGSSSSSGPGSAPLAPGISLTSLPPDSDSAGDVDAADLPMAARAFQSGGEGPCTIEGYAVDAVCVLSRLPEGAEDLLPPGDALSGGQTGLTFWLVSREQLEAVVALAGEQEDIQAEVEESGAETGQCAVALRP